jgi:2-keto-3-deoxy-L-rhamnonate aldolase RhmA
LSNSLTLAEIAGLSYVVVDLEHGPSGIYDALACLRALATTNTPTIIRILDPEPMWVKKALDHYNKIVNFSHLLNNFFTL